MTLPSNSRVSTKYTANGTNKDFAYNFRVFYSSDTGTYGIEVRKVIEGGYEIVSPALYEVIPDDSTLIGGKIRYFIAPDAGTELYVAGKTPKVQQLNLANYGRFSAESIEANFDFMMAIIQEWLSSLDEEKAQRIANDLLVNENTAALYANWQSWAESNVPVFAETFLTAELAGFKQQWIDALNQITLTSVPAVAVPTANGQNQQEINDFGGAKWWNKPLGYDIGSTVKLTNGDIVKSTVANNTVNPNIDMTGWVCVGNLIIVNTVAELVAKNLKNGDVVKTIGYHNLFDNGGSIYVISTTSTDYSIQLSNGTHAVFNDDFDIRKFGVRNNPLLDQTIELDRMSAYVDTREYEIDFHNFSIMTPKTTRWINSSGSVVKGMMFKKPHRLKNLKILNDKSAQLKQGTNCILFAPDDLEGEGLFELDNVTFDPYVADYLVTSGNMDGYMCGFVCEFHPDSGAVYPTTDATRSKYQLSLKKIKFKSPAVSYNISCTNVFFDKIFAHGLSGEFLASYLVANTYDLIASDFNGVFRDDYYATAGRLLVTTLIHHEPEVGGLPLELGDYEVDDASCVRYTDNFQHITLKFERKSSFQRIKSIRLSNVLGSIGAYAGSSVDESIKRKFQIDNFSVSNTRGILSLFLPVYIKELNIDTPVFKTDFDFTIGLLDFLVADSVNIVGKLDLSRYIAFSDTNITNLYLSDVTVNDPDYGLFNSQSVQVDNIVIAKAEVNSAKFMEGKFKTLKISNLQVNSSVTHNNFIRCLHAAGAFEPNIIIKNHHQGKYLTGAFIIFEPTLTGKVTFINSGLAQTDNLVNCNVFYIDSRATSSVTYAPPSLASGVRDSIQTMTLLGAKIGDNINMAFSNSLTGVSLTGYVSAENTISYYFDNKTASTVSLASGKVMAKLI